jgi:DNA modification methylase
MEPTWQSDDQAVRLFKADCLDVLPSIGWVDAVITDPPYGVTYQSNRAVGVGALPITNDGTRLSLSLYRKVLPMLDATHMLWFTRWDAWPDVWDLIGMRMPVRGLLVWDKGTPGMGDLSHWGCSYELIASAGTAKCRGGRDSSVIRMNTVPPGSRNHPTEKPVDLMKYLIEKVTDPGDTVVDPFMGSGPTGVAAVRCGRKFIGIEFEQDHFNTSLRRIQLEMGLEVPDDSGVTQKRMFAAG